MRIHEEEVLAGTEAVFSVTAKYSIGDFCTVLNCALIEPVSFFQSSEYAAVGLEEIEFPSIPLSAEATPSEEPSFIIIL